MTKEELEKAARQEQLVKQRYPEFYKFFQTVMELQRGINGSPPSYIDRLKGWLQR